MRTKGSKNKQRSEKCYKGPIPSYEAFVQLWMKIHQPEEFKMIKKYERFMEDMEKTNFNKYSKVNYEFLVKAGLYQRTKNKYKL